MKKQKILWDMDGCKTQLVPPVLSYLNQRFPDLNWGLEDVQIWNFSNDPEISQAAFDFMNTPGFFRNLEPCPGSIEAYREVVRLGHEVIVCTTPLSGEYRSRCMEEKISWLISHLGQEAAASVLFSDNKTQIEADVIIDDKPHLTIGELNIRFRNWIIVDHPYNRELPDMEHFPVGRIKNDWSNWREEFSKVDLL